MSWIPHIWLDRIIKAGRVAIVNPAEEKALPQSLVDAVDLAVADSPFYYPSATGAPMNPTKDLSLTGQLTDGDGVITLTLEVTNDEDLAAGWWQPVTRGGYRPDDNTDDNVSVTVTDGTEYFAIMWDELNFDHYRVKIVVLPDALPATSTVIVKERKKVR